MGLAEPPTHRTASEGHGSPHAARQGMRPPSQQLLVDSHLPMVTPLATTSSSSSTSYRPRSTTGTRLAPLDATSDATAARQPHLPLDDAEFGQKVLLLPSGELERVQNALEVMHARCERGMELATATELARCTPHYYNTTRAPVLTTHSMCACSPCLCVVQQPCLVHACRSCYKEAPTNCHTTSRVPHGPR